MTNALSAHAPHDKSDWIEAVARAGYAAKGVTYLLVGGLAVWAAFTTGSGGAEGSKGAIGTLADEPFGKVMIGLIGVGLLAYALWQFFRAAMDPEHEGSDKSGIGKRLMFAVSGLLHLSLVLYCFNLVLGLFGYGSGGGDAGADGSGGGERGPQTISGAVMEWPGGKWLVAAVGLGIVAFGLYQLYKAYAADLSDSLDLSRLGASARGAARAVGRAGLAGRGVVFTMIGAFTVFAGVNKNPEEAGGIEKALQTLGGFGAWALGLVGVGLAAYGGYMLLKSRYRRIDAEA